jgi:hypothetical protein
MERIYLSLVSTVTTVLLVASIANAGDQGRPDLSISEAAAVTRVVQEFMAAVARDVTAEGPRAWRKYLSQQHAFIMASNGQLVFESGEAAQKGIGTLEQTIEHIELHWGQSLHIDPLTDRLADVGVPFHEILVQKTGQRVSVDGYFTGLAEHSDMGWQFRSAHWSVPAATTTPK